MRSPPTLLSSQQKLTQSDGAHHLLFIRFVLAWRELPLRTRSWLMEHNILNISQATNPVYILDILNNGPYGVVIQRFETNRLLKQFRASM